ncbi:YciI family protein [Allonocardiopsis opalescens]|uniref:YCII-related domain-containing protein n=1 Tax=Allonocardiopsis opalescens TaxID=1144618 RepID=A0A2T0Q1U3_9ACTN|nr:YciI family protein [Allonocardiopsis opalescens]PRX97680.1 hypothetical protein CLV72_10530 [Allonocardiopsis opalescens]
MPFYVYAQDRPGAGSELLDLAEAHWAYMDRFADRLILRGPTLSDDGEEHTGSVHVIDLDERADAERFATEEPYWRAGLYRRFTAVRTSVLLDRGPAEGPLALVTGEWPPGPRAADMAAGDGTDGRVGYLGVLVDDEGARTTGIVAVVRAAPDEALRVVRPLADGMAAGPAALTARRWHRGGRR